MFTRQAARFLMSWILGLMLISAAAAQEVDPVAQGNQLVEEIQRQLKNPDAIDQQDETQLFRQIMQLRDISATCVETTIMELEGLSGAQEVLTPIPAEGESPPATDLSDELAKTRAAVDAKIQQLQERKVLCELQRLQSIELENQITAVVQRSLAVKLMERGPDYFTVLKSSLFDTRMWGKFVRAFYLKAMGGESVGRGFFALLFLFGLLGFGLGLFVRRWMQANVQRLRDTGELFMGLFRALYCSTMHYAPAIFTLLGLNFYVGFNPHPSGEASFLDVELEILLYFFLGLALLRTVLNPWPPAKNYLPIPEPFARPLFYRARLLLAVGLLYLLLYELLLQAAIDESFFNFIQAFLSLALLLTLLSIIWLTRRLPGWEESWALQLLISLALVLILIISAMGYRNLADFLGLAVVGTILLILYALLIYRVLDEFLDSLDEGRYAWQQKSRTLLGIPQGGVVPGLFWIRLLASVFIWGNALLVILRLWGFPERLNEQLWRTFRFGFEVGEVKVIPLQILLGILVLIVLLNLVRWFKTRLFARMLDKSRMDRATQEALVTTTGYVGISLSFLVAMGVAGFDLANLAIVAGALSVGIGFGLQNVVNNFVSGLIMLFERPVRTGDWIVVGSTEGYVKRISIRTTLIQTFDRGDVIVPNSDLISGQVTNWMLSDRTGRIVLPVGVSYDSDPDQVRDILLEIANQHPSVIRDNPLIADPWIVFKGFGASSLDFELRCIVRDVDSRVGIVSELNFNIFREFRKHNIEIPFPQQDIHFRDPLQLQGEGKTKPAVQPPMDKRDQPPAPDRPPAPKKGDAGDAGGDES